MNPGEVSQTGSTGIWRQRPPCSL